MTEDDTPKLHDIALVSDGWIKKYSLTYRLPDGQLYSYESVSRKGIEEYGAELRHEISPRTDAVTIIAKTSDDELLLIREFRYPLNSWVVSFPAGLIDPGEEFAHAVTRELREETGYAVTSSDPDAVVALPQAGYSSTGMSEESVHIVFANVEKVGEANPEIMEFIEPFLLPIDQVPSFLEENELPIGTRAQLLLELFSGRRYFNK